MKILAIVCNTMGKGKIETGFDQCKSYDNSIFIRFLGVDLQVVYGDPLRLACKQNLPCQKASQFCLIAE